MHFNAGGWNFILFGQTQDFSFISAANSQFKTHLPDSPYRTER